MINKGAILVFSALFAGVILGWLVRGTLSNDQDEYFESEALRHSQKGVGEANGRSAKSGGRRSGLHRANLEDDEHDDESFLVKSEDLSHLLDSKIKHLEERSQMVDPDQALEQAIGVTELEAKRLNEMWSRIKPRLDILRSENVTHREDENGGIWFGVEPFPDEGEGLRLELLRTTIKTLGDARAGVFLKAIQAHQSFGQWGKIVGSEFTVHTFVQEDESLIYEIYKNSTSPGKPGRKWNTSTAPPHLRKLIRSSGANLPGFDPGQ